MTVIESFASMALYAAGLIGYYIGKRSERRKKTLEPTKGICPCEHSIGEHREDGRCVAQTKRVRYNVFGDRAGHEYVKCACIKYYGPLPLHQLFSQGTFVEPDHG